MSTQAFVKSIRFNCFSVIAFIAVSINAFADGGDWESQYSEDGLEVFTRAVEGAQVKAFKVQTVFDAPLQSVIAVIGDTENYPNWFHLCESYTFVEAPAAAGAYTSYYIVSAPWPLKDRDVYVKNRISQDAETYTVTIKSSGAADFAPVKKGYTRVPDVSAYWTFKPVDRNKTYVEFMGHGYPGGIIPVWIANMVVTDVPKKTFQNLRKVLTESRYDIANVSQKEPAFPNLKFPDSRVSLK